MCMSSGREGFTENYTIHIPLHPAQGLHIFNILTWEDIERFGNLRRSLENFRK